MDELATVKKGLADGSLAVARRVFIHAGRSVKVYEEGRGSRRVTPADGLWDVVPYRHDGEDRLALQCPAPHGAGAVFLVVKGTERFVPVVPHAVLMTETAHQVAHVLGRCGSPLDPALQPLRDWVRTHVVGPNCDAWVNEFLEDRPSERELEAALDDLPGLGRSRDAVTRDLNRRFPGID